MEVQDWSLKEEFLAAVEKWYLIAAIFLVGTTAGWFIGLLFPPTYEARADLIVGFNSDAIYLTPDDYKNWQVEELEDLALSEQVMSRTLSELNLLSGGWKDWSEEDIRQVVVPRWRNAGVWHLVATMPNAAQAVELASTWRDFVQDEATNALSHAAEFNRLDRRLDGLVLEISKVDKDLALLDVFRSDLAEWIAVSESEDQSPESQLKRAFVLAERMQRYPTLGIVFSSEFPGTEASLDEIHRWITAELLTIADARQLKLEVHAELIETYSEFEKDWLEEKSASQGLSVYLIVETPESTEVTAKQLNDRGYMAIGTGVIAVMLWLSFRLLRISFRGADENAR